MQNHFYIVSSDYSKGALLSPQRVTLRHLINPPCTRTYPVIQYSKAPENEASPHYNALI